MADGKLAAGQPDSIWIRTTRVHDWCHKHSSVFLTLTDLTFPADMTAVAGVECSVTAFTCAPVARSEAPDGGTVVTLRKQATMELTFVDQHGAPVAAEVNGKPQTVQTCTRFWDEFVQVAAPAAARITCELTDMGCRTMLTHEGGARAVGVELFDVQSIAAEEPVRVRVSAADLLQPGIARPAEAPYGVGGGPA